MRTKNLNESVDFKFYMIKSIILLVKLRIEYVKS